MTANASKAQIFETAERWLTETGRIPQGLGKQHNVYRHDRGRGTVGGEVVLFIRQGLFHKESEV